MLRLLFLALFLFSIPCRSDARVVKLGEFSDQERQHSFTRGGRKAKIIEISCFDNEDCSYDRECVALRCESVCKNSICAEGSYCVPAGKDKPHDFKCVECT